MNMVLSCKIHIVVFLYVLDGKNKEGIASKQLITTKHFGLIFKILVINRKELLVPGVLIVLDVEELGINIGK